MKNMVERDEKGLIKGFEYKYDSNGYIDWKAMIPKEYLVVNSERFKNREVPESIEGLDEKDILVLLGGIKEVARIRGLISRKTKITESGNERAVSVCKLEFIPNFETDGHKYVYSDAASATTSNTNSFGCHYLETIASNRAFVRAVRNALRIDIVGADEVKSYNSPSSVKTDISGIAGPLSSLMKMLDNAGISDFETFKKQLIKSNKPSFPESIVSGWTNFDDIPKDKIFSLMALLKKKK